MRRPAGLTVLVCVAVALSGVSRCAPLPIDTANALDANDYTALIEGCGHQVNDGFISCRKTEGEASADKLTFVAPPVKCKGADPCVTFHIFYPNGDPSFGDSIPQGQTRKDVLWTTLLKRPRFETGDRGFWGYSYAIRYLAGDGYERTTYAQGEIYMRVVEKGYVSLHDVSGDPAFAWSWVEDGAPVRVTTGMRTYVGSKP